MEVLHNVQHITGRIPQISNFKKHNDEKLSVESNRNIENYMQALVNLYLITKQKKKNSKLLVDSDHYRSCNCRKGRRSRNSNFSNQSGKGKNENNNKNNNVNKNSSNKNNNDGYDNGSDSDNDEKKNNFNKEEKENDKKKKKKKKSKKNKENENTEREEREETEENINENDDNPENEDMNMKDNTNLEKTVEWIHDNEEIENIQKKRKVSNVENSGESSINNENIPQRDQSYQDSHANTNISDNTLSLTKALDINEQKKVNENLGNFNPFSSNSCCIEKEKDSDDQNPFNSNEDVYFCMERKNTKIKLDNVLKELKLKSSQSIRYQSTNSNSPKNHNISNNNTNNTNANLQHIGKIIDNNELNGTTSNLSLNSNTHNSNSIFHHYVTRAGQMNKNPVKSVSYNLNKKSQSFGLDRLYNTDNSFYLNNISYDFNKFHSCVSKELKSNYESNKSENGKYTEGEKNTNNCIEKSLNCISDPLKKIKKYVPTDNVCYENNNCVNALKYIKNYSCTNPKQYIRNYNCIKIAKSTISDNTCLYGIKNAKEHLNFQKVSKNLKHLEKNYEKIGDAYKNYINKCITKAKKTISNKKEGCINNNNCNYQFFSNNFYKLASNNCLNLSKVYSRKKCKIKTLNHKKYFALLNSCYRNHVDSFKRKIDRNKRFIHNYCNACYIDCSNNEIGSNDFSGKSSCFDYGNIEVNSLERINSLDDDDMGLKDLYKSRSYNIVRENSNTSIAFQNLPDVNSKNGCRHKKYVNNCLRTSIKALKHLKKIVPSYGTENEIIYDEDKKIFFDLEDNTYINVKGNLYYNTKDKLFYDIEYVQDFSYNVKNNLINFYNFLTTEKYAPCKVIMKMCLHINEFMYNLLSVRNFEMYYKDRQNLVEIIIK
ncbi:conserved Plasmodium protein, unknown function [Plasmodium relictum]|uniref:Uncharacterized protein n=1 Tax=Plasmodium relictum TaxID=85471 RepID=A0A1J1H1W6_PLARL|nr:conserved Plasmodium protein, unknown function [Plasmodium relictum]CRG98851.1 conserved Plasmodium protein, unknown function [Plasmodium relictum]